MGVRDDFDFGPVVQGLYAVAGLKPFADLPSTIPYLLPLETVRAYMAEFFNDNFMIEMNEVMENPELRPPTEDYINPNYTEFRKAAEHIRAGRFSRGKGEYPLTTEETMEAIEIYRANPLLYKTVAAFQASLIEYFKDLRLYHAAHKGWLPEDVYASIDEQLSKTSATKITFFFIHDLMPVTAFELKGKVPNAPLTEDIFSHGLANAFGKGCFATVDPQTERVVHCPFSKLIGHLFNTVLKRGEDGKLHVQDEMRPGALPAFVSREIQSHEAQRASWYAGLNRDALQFIEV